ncbi:hypothetical protein CSA37_09440 [Candidatus Fermentibacteria bacterium]|nr:MAG: hypothetical protein CSA37_09440 [Candidatus Fermentibacteria bacterium]
MKAVLVSGWGTTNEIWRDVKCSSAEMVHISWNKLLTGDFELPERCIAAGWSLGGQMAMDLSRRPEVAGLVLVSSMTCIAESTTRPGIEPERCSLISKMVAMSRKSYLKSFFLECGADEKELEFLLKQSKEFSDGEMISGLSVMFNHIAVPEPSLPAVIIHGTDDRIIPVAVSDYIGKFVLKKSEIIKVEGRGHLLPLHEPELIGKAIDQLAESITS